MIAGKGLSGFILVKLFTYASAHLVILALPLAILISSLMTMGNLGANYELAAIKSAGIGIHRIVTPMLFAVFFFFIFSLWFSFYVVPMGNLKLYSLMWDIQQTKPTFALKAGHFYKGIDGYTIRVANKIGDGSILKDVMIYNTSEGRGNVEMISADSAIMKILDQGMTLQMNLFRGCRYEDAKAAQGSKDQFPFSRYYFDSLRYYFDMSGFGLKRSNENDFGSHYKMLNINQLIEPLDSISQIPQRIRDDFKFIHIKPLIRIDSAIVLTPPKIADSVPELVIIDTVNGILSTFPEPLWYEVLSRALNTARAVRNYTDFVKERIPDEERTLREYQIELHSRYMLPITCLIFLYIGAPLGAIIRKGGVGMPMVVSVCFFIFFWFLMMQGNKLAKEGIVEPWAGIWLPVYILTPLALWITWKASTDSPLFDLSSWNLAGIKKILAKDATIHDSDK